MSRPDLKGEAPRMEVKRAGGKLGTVSGVYIPVCLNILSILMFLRFGLILGQIGFVGIVGLLLVAYCINFLTLFSLSAIASNGEVRGGGPYYLISRSLGPEFGGSIGIMFYLAQTLNSALNIVGLIDCIRLNIGPGFASSFWARYGFQTAALVVSTALCLLGSSMFSKASYGLLIILSISVASIPASAIFKTPYHDHELGIHFTGFSIETLADNFLPHAKSEAYTGLDSFRELFGILFPATAGILAGASMSNELRSPSKSIPKGTLWATLSTFIVYFVVVLFMAASTTHISLLANPNVIPLTNLSQPVIFAGECAVTAYSALIGIKSSTGLFRALARDKLLPGLSFFDKGVGSRDFPALSLLLTYAIAQVALLADLNQIATLISMGFQMTFFVMNLACFFLKVGSAPNFRPGFKFFSWQTAFLGSVSSFAAMFFIDQTYAALAICILIALFLFIHYLCPPKTWGDVSQNLIYHQVRKYLLRLKPEHIKFWRPHIILLVNNPRKQTRLIQFCNSLKKGSLYILGHVIVTDDFNAGVTEAKLQQQAWSNYISESSRIKAFVQLIMSPSLTWGIRNLILSSGLGGMRPNIAVIGFYNMNELRSSNPPFSIPDIPTSIANKMKQPAKREANRPQHRKRGDTSARLLQGSLPTDIIRTEGMMAPAEYMTILEDLALRYKLNVAVGYGFEKLQTPRMDGSNTKKYIDLWPIQMSAEIMADGKSVLTTNFDTYTLILQLGHILRSVQTWRQAYKLRVMVFVEYEHEVEEESARVRALLEKLRIEATVVVFWLASGQLNTYELIINGQSNDIDWEIIVNEALRDEEWWDDLQMFRGRYDNMSASQERSHLSHIIDSTSGRLGVYNPHEDIKLPPHRPKLGDFPNLHRPTIASLSKLGVNVGMHTSHLNDGVLQEPGSERTSRVDVDSSDEDTDLADGDILEDALNSDFYAAVQQPLLAQQLQQGRGSRNNSSSASSPRKLSRSRKSKLAAANIPVPTYGTMSTSQTLMEPNRERNLPADWKHSVLSKLSMDEPNLQLELQTGPDEDIHTHTDFPSFNDGDLRHPRSGERLRTRSLSPSKEKRIQMGNEPNSVASRPGVLRQSSTLRFSSRPVPEATTTDEGDSSRLGFSTVPSRPPSPRVERPMVSRQSSYGHGRFSSRPVPEPKITDNADGQRTIKFAEEPTLYHHQSPATSRQHSRQASKQHSRQHSRQNSILEEEGVSLNISNLVNSYNFQASDSEAHEGASSYSTQGISLSFNELPSRAQNLILNELMRRHSTDTAVLLSTLPVPLEGTSLDECATIRYLSDVEVLCNELPPTLMVLSNNMTVTVSL